MNNTTNTRLANGRSISTLRLTSLSVGLFLIATVPVLANGQKETSPTSKTAKTQPVRTNQKSTVSTIKKVSVKPTTSNTAKETTPVTRTTNLTSSQSETMPVVKTGSATTDKPIIKQPATSTDYPVAKTGRLNDVLVNIHQTVRFSEKPVFGRNEEVGLWPTGHVLHVGGIREEPIFYHGRDFGFRGASELAALSTGIILFGMVSLPAAPQVINAADVQTVVDFKLALIAADISDLQNRIKDRQAREADITNGNVPDANPQQVPSMQAMDQSNQHEIDNLQAEANAIPNMSPKDQLKISRANFNSHISNLKRNKKALQDRRAQLMANPQSDGRDNAVDQIDAQINQDDSDINTLQQMSNQASALL